MHLDFVVRKYDLVSRKIRKPLSIVLLADLHDTEHGKDNADLIRETEKCRPDLILCAGDMLTARPGISCMPAEHFLTEAARIAPVFLANGNHESRVRECTESFGNLYENYTRALAESGVHILNNASEEITLRGSRLIIYGLEVERSKYRRFTHPELSAAEMERALGRRDDSVFSVLLAHNPEMAPAYRKWGADLTVSGHFHGGVARDRHGRAMLNPYGRIMPKYGYGKFTKGEKYLIVTSGAGEHVIPFRINNPMELVHITLR